MAPLRQFARLACASLALVLVACGGQKEPAQRLIVDIEATVTAAAPEAAKYVPDQLMAVQTRLAALKASFDRQEYAAVATEGPSVLGAAASLATAAAESKDQVLKALNDRWSGLAGSVPDNVTAIRARIDFLSKKSGRGLAAGIDLDAAKAQLADAASLWSKAQGAFASGNLDEAVTAADQVKGKVAALAAALKLDLGAPAA